MTGKKASNYSNWRYFNISNFRNLGVYANTDKDSEDRTFLKLNRGLSRDEIGGLVLLLGLNNSGKSNVLAALEKWHSGAINDDDIPDFLVQKRRPVLNMNVAKGQYPILDANGEYDYSIFEFIKSPPITSKISQGLQSLGHYVSLPEIIAVVNNLLNLINNYISGARSSNNINYQNAVSSEINNDISRNIARFVSHVEDEIVSFNDDGRKIYDVLQDGAIDLKELLPLIQKTDGKTVTFRDKFGYVLSQNVYRYQQVHITNDELRCHGNQLNGFFKTILSIMNTKYEDFVEMYKNSLNNKGLRKMYQMECNSKLSELSDDFNDLFTSDPENEYRFEIEFETEMVFFTIYRGGISLGNLDRQSDGFRWIFDFFINFLKKVQFKPGDIVLMDEFGYNLNPKSIKMLTYKLRDIAQDSGLTFVIATQNFMIIDTDHLDEVRLVVNKPNGNTEIINEFDQFEHENHDILEPLLDSLTVTRNYLIKPGHQTIFVEGTSDYFYLTAFVHYLEKNGKKLNVSFYPINGVGRNFANHKEAAEELLRAEKNPIVLVDGDGPGSNFKKYCIEKRKISSVMMLPELMGKEIVFIEDLFSEEDRNKLSIDEKSFDRGALFSQHYEKYIEMCSDETKKNFETLIDKVMLG